MKKLIFCSVLTTSSLYCGSINVAVAANVSYAIDDLKKEFHKLYPNTKVKITLGSSGKLTAQITHGAPYDVFMSADMKYPYNLYRSNKSITKPEVYALGSLAILSSKKRDFSKGLDILKDSNIRKIAIANPKTAPYGTATISALKNSDIYDLVKSKFVYAESISQTVAYSTKATDIGIIAKSSLYSSKMSQYKENINWISVDKSLYSPIEQGIVLLKNSKDNNEAKEFYDFILSDKAKKILINYGYLVQ